MRFSDLGFAVLVFTSTLASTAFAKFTPVKIATGDEHTCALSSAGTVKCWGSNDRGQLGTGDLLNRGDKQGSMGKNLSEVDLGLGSGDRVVDICAGQEFSCAATKQGKLKCWGGNYTGRLGHGNSAAYHIQMGESLPVTDLGEGFSVASISCGAYHACALSSQGTAKCWGHNGFGALGYGDSHDRGSSPADMGSDLPVLKNLVDLQEIVAGATVSCARSSQGIRCWGNGGFGQLGLESDQDRGHNPETLPGKSPMINLTTNSDEKLLSISVGASHSCALMAKDTTGPSTHSVFVKCWGNNDDGILATHDYVNHGAGAETMGANLPIVQLAVASIASIRAHDQFTCVLTRNAKVKCWGRNLAGTLGLEDTASRGLFAYMMGANLKYVDLGLPVKALSVGPLSRHSCAILINNQIKCWGNGLYGRLGYESDDDVGNKPGQMGDALPFVQLD